MYMRWAISSAREGRRESESERVKDARCRREECRRGSRERVRRCVEVREKERRSGTSRNERMWRRSSSGRREKEGVVALVCIAWRACRDMVGRGIVYFDGISRGS